MRVQSGGERPITSLSSSYTAVTRSEYKEKLPPLRVVPSASERMPDVRERGVTTSGLFRLDWALVCADRNVPELASLSQDQMTHMCVQRMTSNQSDAAQSHCAVLLAGNKSDAN